MTTNKLKLNHFQEHAQEKISNTKKNVIKEILTTIIGSGDLSPSVFMSLHVTGKQTALPVMNVRNKKISENIVLAIEEDLSRIPTLSQSFETLADFTNDPDVRKKFVKGIAFSHILPLVAYLDKTRRSLIQSM
jgi:hypothetical protein